ncbi:hypothetical protein BKA82DRAFT_4329081 [Pisolithus tinctorius]|nr:hypothetical protein BKA82DRAFT_4329081 [Pisolithus tinctorius]
MHHLQQFQSQGEWSLAKFLAENLMQTQIKRFLTLPWFHNNPRPSFTSAEELLGWMDTLPSGPKWQSTTLELIWHDAEEVVQSLFGNPIFSANMMFDPILVMTALGQEYNEWFSACKAHHIQDSLPDGATIVPILAALDKTPVTRMTGGLGMHPLFISIGLKHFVDTGSMMLDPHGHLQHCFTPLNVHPWDNLNSFQRQAKMLQLNGVCLPFWRNWPFSNPSTFLLPEILHTCHKFFFDHVLPWCKVLLGDELDVQFKCHHKHIAVRHFASGVSHVKQMMGREHCDIQCTIIPMIAGCVPPQFLHQAQSPMHTDSSVEAMELSLHEFHTHKDAIIEARARMTESGVGAFSQFCRVSEHLLITHCKHPFQCTNEGKDFVDQVVQLLDHKESMQQFDMYLLIHSSDIPLINAVSMEEEEITTANPMLAWVECVLPEQQWQLQGPHPICNYFANGILANHAQIALHIMSCPDETNLSLNDIMEQYSLPDFQDCYLEFLQLHSIDVHFDSHTFNHVAVWHKFHVQLYSTFCTSTILPSQVVQALCTSPDFPHGCCDIVLISPTNDASYVAQVCTIFQPHACPCSKVEAPLHLNNPLIYLQPFCVIATPEQQPEMQMWTLERCFSNMEGKQK